MFVKQKGGMRQMGCEFNKITNILNKYINQFDYLY